MSSAGGESAVRPSFAGMTLPDQRRRGSAERRREGVFEVPVIRRESRLADPFMLEADWDATFRPEGEARDLAFVLMEIRAENG
jgi:hypothetical protein